MATSRLERIGTIFSRKENTEKLFLALNTIFDQYEIDIERMRENEEKLQKLFTTYMKNTEQGIVVHVQRLQALRNIFSSFKKQVEGILRSGAMKPEDRPLWWDIYRAFPPIREPTYSRPAPSIECKPIFYKEDLIRAKFHKNNEAFGTVTLSEKKIHSNTQKFINIYKKLEPEFSFNEVSFEESLKQYKEQFGSNRKSEDYFVPSENKTFDSDATSNLNLKNIFQNDN